MIRTTLKGLALLALCGHAWAEEPASEATCRNSAGVRIYTPACNDWFKVNQPLGSDLACHDSPACREEVMARGAAQQRKRDEEHKAALAALAREEAALRAKCGRDLNAPRIGMPIRRALECTEDLVLLTEERTASGLVRTYGDGANFLRAAGGKVVAVGRY